LSPLLVSSDIVNAGASLVSALSLAIFAVILASVAAAGGE
jgi:hypothetical protein